MDKSVVDHPVLAQLDRELYALVNGVEILEAVAPKNFQQQKQAFFDSKCTLNPAFVYEQHKIDLFQRKRALYQLPVENLPDPDLIQLYSEVIESYVDKLDQYRSVGTSDFVYDSLRYYGEPTVKDIRNAHFVLHVPNELGVEDSVPVDAEGILAHLKAFADMQGYQYELVLSEGMIANALVSGTQVRINTRAKVCQTEVYALAHHELGVHLVTTLNARQQPLNILSLGSPVNTTTQEGLAILCEYLAGYLTVPRLKILALRVIAVQSMLVEKDFKRTFQLLKEQYKVDDQLAFTICARVYRGGGFTKDYLYLQGFHQMLNAYENCPDFHHLLAGKVSIEQLPLVTRLINKGYLNAPTYISPAISQPSPIEGVSRFMAHAIK